MIKEAHDHLTACEYCVRTVTKSALLYWKMFRLLRKKEECANARMSILMRVILNDWFRMRGYHSMARLAVRVHREQIQQYASIPFRVWKFHWKEALLQRHSPPRDSFKLWVHRNHVRSKKIVIQRLSLACATLEVLMKKERKRYKNSKEKLLRQKRRGGYVSTVQSKGSEDERWAVLVPDGFTLLTPPGSL